MSTIATPDNNDEGKNKDKAITKVVETKLKQLSQVALACAEAYITAGDILVELLDKDEVKKEVIVEKSGIPMGVLDIFERVGRKQLHPGLLLADYPAADPIMTLPFSDQEKLMTIPIEVVVLRDADKTEILQIDAKNLTKPQCKQVFSGNRAGRAIRNPGAQRAYLETEKTKQLTKKAVKTPTQTYRIDGKVITILVAPLQLNVKEWSAILQQALGR